MRSFASRHKAWFGLLCTGLLALLLVVATLLSGGRASPLTGLWNRLFLPVEKGFSAVLHWAGTQFADRQSMLELQDDNTALRAQVAQLEQQLRATRADTVENQRLRTLLGMADKRRDLTFAAAAIVERDDNGWRSRMTLDVGTADGVAADMCVVNESMALVGVITEVGDGWAKVASVVDPETSVGAVDDRTGGLCMASGSFELMSKGRLQLTFLPQDTGVQQGDLILSSGAGQLYPPGITIGRIEAVETQPSGMGVVATVSPAAMPADADNVYVITGFTVVN